MISDEKLYKEKLGEVKKDDYFSRVLGIGHEHREGIRNFIDSRCRINVERIPIVIGNYSITESENPNFFFDYLFNLCTNLFDCLYLDKRDHEELFNFFRGVFLSGQCITNNNLYGSPYIDQECDDFLRHKPMTYNVVMPLYKTILFIYEYCSFYNINPKDCYMYVVMKGYLDNFEYETDNDEDVYDEFMLSVPSFEERNFPSLAEGYYSEYFWWNNGYCGIGACHCDLDHCFYSLFVKGEILASSLDSEKKKWVLEV